MRKTQRQAFPTMSYLQNFKNYKMTKIKLPKPKSAGQQHIELVLKTKNIDFVNEFKFLPDRNFRFDIAIPDLKIAIEYEGLETTKNDFSALDKSFYKKTTKSRHSTNLGYSNDCIKYNLAVVNGWKILRFTAYNYREFSSFISILI